MARDLEETIAWTMGYCQHYEMRGMPKACAAGVEYASVGTLSAANPDNLAKPGCRPCIHGVRLADPLALCPKWLRATREQGIKRHEDMDRAFRNMALVLPVIQKWRTWSKAKPVAKAEVIECPVCKGRLHLSQAAYNGHVHGQCETEGCVSWME